MKNYIAVILACVVLAGCGSVDTGEVGVRTTFTGKVVSDEIKQGFYTSWTSSVRRYSVKEITVELFDITPKAADNLSLQDMDVEVYYVPRADQVAELKIKYANRDAREGRGDAWYPAYELVRSYARNAIYAEVAKYNSLEIHKNRESIARAVRTAVQQQLDRDDPGVFAVTKVIVRDVRTDISIEQSIKLAVAKNKELEAKTIELDIARKQEEINKVLDASLTPAVLEQRRLDVQLAAIEKGANVNLFLGQNVTPLVQVGK